MTTFKLNKTAKGKKFEYTVTDENGQIISKRSSTRDYVACTADGSFYFGRLDLIGKGDHGRTLSSAEAFIANPEKAYEDYLKYFIPTERAKQRNDMPYEKYISQFLPHNEDRVKKLKQIAYL